MGKTLYVSDLDGTLLRKNQTLSGFTTETVNRLVKNGVIFSYATARSKITAQKAAAGISPAVPIIVYNGAFILENGTGKILHGNFLGRQATEEIFSLLQKHDVLPVVYAYIDGVEKFSYCKTGHSRGATDFLATRKGDIRERMTEKEHLTDGDVFYFSCIDEKDKLEPLYEMLKDQYHCIFSCDIYSGDYWLEVLHKDATKATAVLKLKEMLACDKIVVFGDHENDLSMFRIADQSYAVANAEASVKEAATAVIGSNEEDGVAKWLLEHADKVETNDGKIFPDFFRQ